MRYDGLPRHNHGHRAMMDTALFSGRPSRPCGEQGRPASAVCTCEDPPLSTLTRSLGLCSCRSAGPGLPDSCRPHSWLRRGRAEAALCSYLMPRLPRPRSPGRTSRPPARCRPDAAAPAAAPAAQGGGPEAEEEAAHGRPAEEVMGGWGTRAQGGVPKAAFQSLITLAQNPFLAAQPHLGHVRWCR